MKSRSILVQLHKNNTSIIVNPHKKSDRIYLYRFPLLRRDVMLFFINLISMLFRWWWYTSYTKHNFSARFSCSMPLDDIGQTTTCKGFILSNSPFHNKSSSPKKKILMFLSGLLTCANEPYLQKVVHDLMELYPNLDHEYTLLVYQNFQRTSLEVAAHIVSFIEHYNSCLETIEELNIVGFSMGGVLAGNVMTNTTFLDANCTRRVITYDTPMSILQVMRRFSQNWVYRFDVLYYYYIALNTYREHVDNVRIRAILLDGRRFPVYRGLDKALGQLKRIYGFTDQELNEKTEFTYDQPPATEIHHLYFKEDPIIDVDFNVQYRNKKIRELLENKPIITVLEKPGFEHCTDIWKNNDFAKYILRTMRLPSPNKYFGKTK